MWEQLVDFVSNKQTVGAAIVAGVVALLTQLWNPIVARRLERQKAELQEGLEKVRATFADLNAARNARRDYEYEARKRLYEEIEPLLFQLYEATERAYACVLSLARTSRGGNLGAGKSNWLADEGYYLHATIHRLLMPAVFLRIIQRRMTFVDLDVDESIRTKYYLLKMYVWSFTDDFDFAKLNPELTYDPNNENWRNLIKVNPAVYKRQGIVVGDVDDAVDAMLVKEGDILRPMTFGEFQAAIARESEARPNLVEPVLLYRGFDPSSHPVLARMLHTQGCIAKLLIDSFGAASDRDLSGLLRSFVSSSGFLKDFSWSKEADVDVTESAVVQAYIVERLERIPKKGR